MENKTDICTADSNMIILLSLSTEKRDTEYSGSVSTTDQLNY